MTLLMERKEAAGRPVVLHELPRCGSAPPSVAVDALAFLHWLLAERDDTGAADTGACHGGALLGGEYADIDAALRRAIASLCYDGDIASSGPAGGSGGGGPASPALRLRLAFTMDAAPLTAAGAPRKLDTWTSRGKERRRNAANLSGILGGAAGKLGGRSMGSLPVTPEAELRRTQEMVLPVTQMRLPSASEDMPGPSEFCLVAASGPKDAAALPEAERVKLPKQLPRAREPQQHSHPLSRLFIRWRGCDLGGEHSDPAETGDMGGTGGSRAACIRWSQCRRRCRSRSWRAGSCAPQYAASCKRRKSAASHRR